MRWAGWLLLLILAIATGCRSEAVSTAEPSSCVSVDPLRILVLGDSIAAGHPLHAPDRWSDTLQAILRVAQPARPVEIRNLAKAGSKVDFLTSSTSTESDLASYRFAIVIEGVNDLVATPLSDWARRYRAAIERLEARGLTVIVGTAPPAFAPGEFLDTYDQVAKTLRLIAAERSRPLLDIERQWRDLGAAAVKGFYVDVVHQNHAGQAVMADLAASLIGTQTRAC
jgi:lysophospholipase L1-like esterase